MALQSTVGKDSVLPPDVRENPFSKLVLEPQQVQQYHLAKSFTAHNMAVTRYSKICLYIPWL